MNTVLLDILKILTPEEFKQFRLVLRSSLYSSSSSSEKLYTALRPKYPDFELSPTDLRKIYKKVFPKKNFSPKNLQKAFDALLETTEAYLLKLKLEKEEILKEKITIIMADERAELFDLFKKSQNNIHEVLEEKNIKNEEYWSKKTELYDRLYSNLQHDKYNTTDDTLDKLNEATDYYFMHLKMHYALLLKNINSDLNPRFLDDCKNAMEKGDFGEEELLKNYKEALNNGK